MQTPLPPEPLPIPADEGTIVLPIGKQKRISHSFRNKSIEKGITQKYLSPPMISVHPRKVEFPENVFGATPKEQYHHQTPMSQSQIGSVHVLGHGSRRFRLWG
jgi:hypothetical protein